MIWTVVIVMGEVYTQDGKMAAVHSVCSYSISYPVFPY